jgi:hypothetical protein
MRDNSDFVKRINPINQTMVVEHLLAGHDTGPGHNPNLSDYPSTDNIRNYRVRMDNDELQEAYPELWEQFENSAEDEEYDAGFDEYVIAHGKDLFFPAENDPIMEWYLVDQVWADKFTWAGEAVLTWGNCCWWGRRQYGQAIAQDKVIERIRRNVEE